MDFNLLPLAFFLVTGCSKEQPEQLFSSCDFGMECPEGTIATTVRFPSRTDSAHVTWVSKTIAHGQQKETFAVTSKQAVTGVKLKKCITVKVLLY